MNASADEPRLAFSPEAWRTIELYTTLCPFEIGGLGTIRAVGGDLEVVDVFVVRQDVNDITTRLDGDDIDRLIGRLVDDGEDPGALRLWWHSHALELTFWSGEDEQTISGFKNELMVSLVTNHELRLLARLDRYLPRTTTWVHVDRPTTPIEPSPNEIDATRAAIADAVRYLPAGRRERVL